jgi:hypothetical protein
MRSKKLKRDGEAHNLSREERKMRDIHLAGRKDGAQACLGKDGQHAGGESLENKRRKEDKHKQDGFEGNWKGEDVEKRKRVRGSRCRANYAKNKQ